MVASKSQGITFGILANINTLESTKTLILSTTLLQAFLNSDASVLDLYVLVFQ